ncbi:MULTISPECIES: aldehyde dehydrogenase family protein [Mycobacterium]|uniref:Aldehyde dehydrogenase n=1 Tax=Mycobacterium kiyosense TaxID=2871094 RepID=A0A9P3Q0U4_9MYCO|nr:MULTISPECIES: aldehyde dehydrogenase family protein [Mycobacterium]BDB44054.1 aldehyde dehydrogenase [Mycobacterium kiyosense]BDE15590.1 aldehyde dehydrogenase [Mycobacterium sp. 20KCMC460]GLB80987.1 aldehyde dehydrogenase [Mycobacterium kiyosense]GLB87253.1 aldehyde dehydrogenase [Mycobacterium kiyosense]GLB93467.1 aldehyde dehydrogenase [Mycobacterium kiyosense]
MATQTDLDVSDSQQRSKYLSVRCPADGRVVGTVPDMTPAQVHDIAAQLRAAQPAWEDLGPDGRAKHLLRLLDWVLDNEKRLIGIMQEETGKSWGDAQVETAVFVDTVNYFTKHAVKFLADRTVKRSGALALTKNLRVFHRPHQLVGIITPWNGPLATSTIDGVPALMAGAAVMFKPSEVTPLTWAEVTRGWREDIGGPPVIACVTGGGGVGAAVVDEVDMVQFTGSTATGRKIAARAGERLIPCSLELGGKDAMIVLDDADIDRATSGAVWGGLWNSGQICVSVERIYVQDKVYDEFVAKLTAKVSTLRQGMDRDGSFQTEIGAMATANQLSIVERHVGDAVQAGARALTGGKRAGSGMFFEPTVLVDVDHSMACMREETFGPTLPVMRVRDEDEAVRLANDSPYGLAASVFSGNPERADRVARRLETGAVNINSVLTATMLITLPMGGWKSSGVGGRNGGAAGLLKFCRQQAVVTERFKLKSEPHWYPYQPRMSRLQARLVRLTGAHDWRRRLGRPGKK